MTFHPGDRIKMTDRYAAAMMLSTKFRQGVNWRTRRGVVHNANCNSVSIKWDDRVSLDQHPNGAIELDV